MLTRRTFLKCPTRSFPFIVLKYFYFQLYKMLSADIFKMSDDLYYHQSYNQVREDEKNNLPV